MLEGKMSKSEVKNTRGQEGKQVNASCHCEEERIFGRHLCRLANGLSEMHEVKKAKLREREENPRQRSSDAAIRKNKTGLLRSLRSLAMTGVSECRRTRSQEDRLVNKSCHPEFISGSVHSEKWKLPWSKMLKRVQHDKCAFTLAEVLITIGIIGVVAAITIPSLAQSYKKKVYSTRLQKFYSVMKQTVRMSEAENGSVSGWSFEQELRDDDGKMIVGDRIAKGEIFAQKYILPYIKMLGTEDVSTWEYLGNSSVPMILLPDGSGMTILNGGSLATDIYYDVNGKEKPNKIGRDQYNFAIYKENSIGFDAYYYNYERGTDSLSLSYRNSAKSNCANKNLASCCSTLLKLDNWKFRKDYPYKL